MRVVAAIALTLCAAASGASAAVPRGVMTSLKGKYEGLETPQGRFQCLNGQGVQIPASYVNDDYCDCADGSDEPGTAACTYLADRFPAEFRFECANEGYEPQHFFHSRVNDGICDCCDGSDEYLPKAMGGIECPNTCAEAHAKAAQARAEREKVRQAGLEARAGLVGDANRKLAEQRQVVTDAEAKIKELEPQVALEEKDKNKWEAEEKAEREEIHQKSLKAKEQWELEREQKKLEAETAAAAEKPAEEQPAAAAEEIRHTEASGEKPPNVICTKWRQTGDCKGNGPRQPDSDKDCDVVIASGDSGFCECVDMRTGLDVEYPFDCNHRPLTCQKMCEAEGKDTGFVDQATADAANAASSTTNEEEFKVDDGSGHTKPEAQDARDRLARFTKEKEEHENKLKEAKEMLESDLYGPDHVWLALKGRCFEKNDGHYQYRICPFDRVEQGHTSLGSWKAWGEQTYGSWGGKYDFAKMLFDNGLKCWNGPARSCDVRVVCGPTNDILSADEPSMCAYSMVFQTPAICE